MRETSLGLRIATGLLWLVPAVVASAAPVELSPTPGALVKAIDGHRVVLLGEVHDNVTQHALRAAALRQWVTQGARPALVFEQFDREHQPDIDRARHERPADADYLIAQAKGNADWHWESYRPLVALALEFDLPIVAANLSRAEAMRVAEEGWADLFDPARRSALALDALPADLWRKHEEAIAEGHCNLLPAEDLPALARAQMARDIVMAESIRPYLDRGAVLLAGNGHVRRDIGVRFWLPADAARSAISIGMLERDDGSVSDSVDEFDAYVVTERAQRADPCIGLTKELKPAGSR
jgi:uncharacterized iron-regulated protein